MDGRSLKRRGAEIAEEMLEFKLCVLCASAFPIFVFLSSSSLVILVYDAMDSIHELHLVKIDQ